MQLLHAKGALLDGQDQDGRTALHQAIRYNRLAETKWLVGVRGRQATRASACVELPLSFTCFCLYLWTGFHPVHRMPLKKGIKCLLVPEPQRCYSCCSNLCTVFTPFPTQIAAGAHLDVADFEGLLPLHQAACTGNVELAKLLVSMSVQLRLNWCRGRLD